MKTRNGVEAGLNVSTRWSDVRSTDWLDAIRRLSNADLLKRCGQFEAANCGMAWLLKLALPALHEETKWKLYQHSECFKVAERICGIGFDNPKDIQDHLSAAKDHLYQAAIRFKAEANSAYNDPDQGRRASDSKQP